MTTTGLHVESAYDGNMPGAGNKPKKKRKGVRLAVGSRLNKRQRVLSLEEYREHKTDDIKSMQLEYETYKTVNEVAIILRKLVSHKTASDSRSDVESKCLEWTARVLEVWSTAVSKDYAVFDKVVCAHYTRARAHACTCLSPMSCSCVSAVVCVWACVGHSRQGDG